MPKPHTGEAQDYFVSRCIPIVKSEHPELSHKAVIGRCYGLYSSWKSKKGKK